MRLIDADVFLEDESEVYMLAQLKVTDEATRLVNEVVHKKVQLLVKDAPTVDAVVVVRCKDCRKRRENETCNVIEMTVADDGFCDLGEKRRPMYDFEEENDG